jgi:cytochrome b561
MQRDPISKASSAATRIAAGDDRTTYDRISVALHWITAVLVLTLFLLAQIWGFTPRPTRHVLIAAHMSLGILLTAVLIARISWRLSPGHQAPPANAGWGMPRRRSITCCMYCWFLRRCWDSFCVGREKNP